MAVGLSSCRTVAAGRQSLHVAETGPPSGVEYILSSICIVLPRFSVTLNVRFLLFCASALCKIYDITKLEPHGLIGSQLSLNTHAKRVTSLPLVDVTSPSYLDLQFHS
ncbi:hypothetical protein EUGRSUZ_L00673 [Eucalyptus grandis]|uniref:Uncharacterized protein n=1 Tax=Eucalyptus grandis TaxID=71139 RepID=A0A058ZW47_EUCGR|nr:hypothetical protein EUGRSUZ_L00673 [Eucalyptus grandis]